MHVAENNRSHFKRYFKTYSFYEKAHKKRWSVISNI